MGNGRWPWLTRLVGDERVRFVIIGGVNTVVGYVLFVLAFAAVGQWVGSVPSLWISYMPATLIAFVLHRRFTFRPIGGHWAVDLVRFEGVYLVSLAINSALLFLATDVVRFPALPSQAVATIVTTLVSYVGHKWFSFRRAANQAASDDGHHEAGR